MVNLDYLYDPNAAKKSFVENYLSDKKLGFSVIERGTVLPHKKTIDGKSNRGQWGFGGIVDDNGKFIKSSHVYSSAGAAYVPEEPIQQSPKTVIYLGMFHSTWGHVITDNIRRLWFLKSNDFKNYFKNCPLVYLICAKKEDFNLKSYQSFRRLLEILEIDVDRLQLIEQPTCFDKIILPDESFFIDTTRKFTNEYREMIDQIRDFALKNRTPISSKKLYFFYGNIQIGEERLAEYFKSKGYEIITHEQRADFDEELNLLANCEIFASTLGSCAMNSLFLRDGTETIFIPRGARKITSYQKPINQLCSLNANYIDSTLSLFHRQNCFIISKQLKNFFGDKFDGYTEDDFKIFLQYVKNCNDNGFLFNLVENYRAILPDFMEQLNRREDLIASYNMPTGWDKFRPLINYRTYVAKKGWCPWQTENQSSNPPDQKLYIQALRINFVAHKVYCSVYYDEDDGWSAEVATPETFGTPGKRKSITGIKIRLDAADEKKYDILYRVHKFDGAWTPWAKNGEELLSQGIALNAIQIKLETKRT